RLTSPAPSITADLGRRPARHARRVKSQAKSLISLLGGPFRAENGGRLPADVVALWSVRPELSRTLGAALWALQCCLEHADQLRPVPVAPAGNHAVDRTGRRPGAGGDQPDRGDHRPGGGVGYRQERADL